MIKEALDASHLSQRQAAKQAGISESRWRQIVTGYQSVDGIKHPVRGPDETLARMAYVVHVSAGQLEEADRPKAAAILRGIEAKEHAKAHRATAGLPPGRSRVAERWPLVQAVLTAAGAGLGPAELARLHAHIEDFFADREKVRLS